MPRPPANAPKGQSAPALTKLPKAPSYMSKEQAKAYQRIGKMLVDAGTLTASDLLTVESAARVHATLQRLYANPNAAVSTIMAAERLFKELSITLGMTPSSRKNTPRLGKKSSEDDEIGGLLE